MQDERYVGSDYLPGDEMESSLRPQSLLEYVGQENIKESLTIYLEAARQRKQPIDHVLLYGPPGLGKTTLACIIAREMNAQIRITSGPAIENPANLAAMLNNLNEGDILFIDEIHRLSKQVEEVLYPAMEDFALDIFIGKGPSARSIRVNLPRFTLIGATTQAGSLSSPLRDRFGIPFRLETYTPKELSSIVKRSAGILGAQIEEDGALEIARRSRGTPRIANRLLKRVFDYALVKHGGVITLEASKGGLEMLAIDDLGLDRIDRTLLEAMIVKFGGKPVGLNTLAAATGEDTRTIVDVYEPYLLQLGFIARTPNGRIPMDAAYRHMGIAMPEKAKERARQLVNQLTIEELTDNK